MEHTQLSKYDEMVGKYARNRTFLRVMLFVIKSIMRTVSLPGIRKLHPWVRPGNNLSTVLPINQELKSHNVLVPVPIVTAVIEKSSHRMIMHGCGCRRAYDCQNHSKDIGCLFMGESVTKISPGLGRLVSKEEAIAHLHKAIDNGLVPGIGNAAVDKFIFNLGGDAKYTSVCFCCHCCCLGESFNKLPAEHLNRIAPRIKGLSVEVTEDCVGCGNCLEYCLYNAISIEDGRSVRSEMCRGCGRCVRYCPNHAVRISLDNPEFADDIIRRTVNFMEKGH